jgi:hypothetical protein
VAVLDVNAEGGGRTMSSAMLTSSKLSSPNEAALCLGACARGRASPRGEWCEAWGTVTGACRLTDWCMFMHVCWGAGLRKPGTGSEEIVARVCCDETVGRMPLVKPSQISLVAWWPGQPGLARDRESRWGGWKGQRMKAAAVQQSTAGWRSCGMRQDDNSTQEEVLTATAGGKQVWLAGGWQQDLVRLGSVASRCRLVTPAHRNTHPVAKRRQ